MELKFLFGIAKIDQNHTFQNLENTTNHGRKPLHSSNVKNVVLQNLLVRIEHLTPGWIIVFRHFMFQNIPKMMIFSKRHIPLQLDLKQRISFVPGCTILF